MKNLILTTLLFCFASAQTIWRVDNNTQNVADFVNLQNANDDASVQNGDIIYISGSVTNYGDVTLNKHLRIFGPGYFLGENPNTQASKLGAAVDEITFAAGSENTEIYGLTAYRIHINTDNILVTRCRFTYTSSAVNVSGTVSNSTANVVLSQNYNHGYFNISNYVQDVVVTNNFASYISVPSTSSAIISNNTFYWSSSGVLSIYNSNIQNNFFSYTGNYSSWYDSGRNNTVVNNISQGTGLNTGDGNVNSTLQADVFELSGSTDGQFVLKDGSPAAGAANDGGDVGAFGGINPYVLSGLPPIPSIYSVTIPVYGTSAGLNVNIKAKSNN